MKERAVMRTKRVFIAVKINAGDTFRNMISDLKANLKDEKIKWTGIDNFHITIAFLGDTAEEKILSLDKMLEEVCKGTGDFDIVLKGAGVFKNLRDPRVLWAGLEPSEKLDQLYQFIKKGLKETGITIEDRSFNPHLTLGRIKNITDNDGLKKLIDKYDGTSIQNQTISNVILYESILYPTGPVYKPLGVYSLSK